MVNVQAKSVTLFPLHVGPNSSVIVAASMDMDVVGLRRSLFIASCVAEESSVVIRQKSGGSAKPCVFQYSGHDRIFLGIAAPCTL